MYALWLLLNLRRFVVNKHNILTNVIFMVDDRVEWHIFVPQVALSRLDIIRPTGCVNKAFKLTIDDRPVRYAALLT